MAKYIGKNISKNLSGKYSLGMLAMRQNFLIMLNNLQQMRLNLLQKNNSKNSRSKW